MKIDLDQQLIRLNGEHLIESDEPITFSFVAYKCLTAPIKSDEQETADKLVIRGLLAAKVDAGGEIDLTHDELTLIKDRTHKVYWQSVELCMAIFSVIDPKPPKAVAEDA